MSRQTWMAAALLAAGTLGLTAQPAVAGGAEEHTFRKSPINGDGIGGLADLRGKPVLIDFWGTR